MTGNSSEEAAGNARPAPALLSDMIRSLRGNATTLFGFSGLINLLALSVSIYLMQIFDRVLSSGSRETLGFLTLAVGLALLLSGVLDVLRMLVANRLAGWISATSANDIMRLAIFFRDPVSLRRGQSLRDLGQLRSFLSTPILFNLFDAAWIPAYLLVIFLLHVKLGFVALTGVVALGTMVWLNDRFTRPAFEAVQIDSSANQQDADRFLRNAEVIEALGMTKAVTRRWSDNFVQELSRSIAAQDIASWITAASKLVRLLLQVALLAVGALLVLNLQITGGAMIASTILVGRLLAPVEAAIGQWRQFTLARQSYNRIVAFQSSGPVALSDVILPAPSGALEVRGLTYIPAGTANPVLRQIDFELESGDALAIIGPSASGKTTLARLLIGMLPPTVGHVRMDGAEVSKWPREQLGKHIGYMPQEVELFPASIFANIARFEIADSQDVIGAAQLAGCHQMILGLPDGYETVLNDNSNILSGGQKQRVGLARALFRQPGVVVLDEPNAHLDGMGESALLKAMSSMKTAGQTVIVVAHRASLLRAVDKILVLQDGRVRHFGPRDQVLRAMDWQSDTTAPSSADRPSREALMTPAGGA